MAHHSFAAEYDVEGDRPPAMAVEPLRVASLGMGWWLDVLADRSTVSGKLTITLAIPAPRKAAAFAANMAAAGTSYEAFSPTRTSRPSSIPRPMACISRPRAPGGRCRQACLSRQTIANTVSDGRESRDLRNAGVVWLGLSTGRREASSAG